jgi:hypothetical protein
MILSHTRKFIFIKTRKVSGTSMEISLSQFCGEGDIITPISYEDEIVRLDLGGVLPQNYGDPKEQQFRDLIMARRADNPKTRHKGQFYNHVPAVEVRDYVGQEVWNEYFTFSMERHPYDKVVSHVYFHARRKDKWDFEKELKRILKKGYYVSYPVYSDGETPIVDFIVNYENLQEDLAKLSDKLGFDVAEHYPQTKHTYRPDRRPGRELLSQEAKDIIYENCKVEFDALGFER